MNDCRPLRHICQIGAKTGIAKHKSRVCVLAPMGATADHMVMDDFQSLGGRLLVAMPGIGDPRFEQAVILLCVHRPDHAMGLRLDRPAPGVDLKTVLNKLDLPAPQTTVDQPVMMGGPVDRERGFVLHSDDWLVPETSVPLDQGLAMTGTRDALVAMASHDGPRRSRLFLGYAGWDGGQLEEELAENVWLIVEAEEDLLFDSDYVGKWSRAVARLGVDGAMLSAQSGRA